MLSEAFSVDKRNGDAQCNERKLARSEVLGVPGNSSPNRKLSWNGNSEESVFTSSEDINLSWTARQFYKNLKPIQGKSGGLSWNPSRTASCPAVMATQEQLQAVRFYLGASPSGRSLTEEEIQKTYLYYILTTARTDQSEQNFLETFQRAQDDLRFQQDIDLYAKDASFRNIIHEIQKEYSCASEISETSLSNHNYSVTEVPERDSQTTSCHSLDHTESSSTPSSFATVELRHPEKLGGTTEKHLPPVLCPDDNAYDNPCFTDISENASVSTEKPVIKSPSNESEGNNDMNILLRLKTMFCYMVCCKKCSETAASKAS